MSEAQVGDEIQRAALPIPDRPKDFPTTYSAADPSSKFPPITPLRPPPGSPNVLFVLLDDVGFGASSAFGGPCQVPTAERLAADGLKFTRFHTTAMCAPTRQALLTGRNHHTVSMGAITEIATSAPGYTGIRPNTCAPLAEILKLNGYSTAQFGKCHEVPPWETSQQGPFDRWPSGGGGFEYFWGFLGAFTNQYYPNLIENGVAVQPDKTPEEGYHFMEDMTDRAIAWVQSQKALTPDKPFFMYFAPGATHAPHQIPLEYADKYRGKFDGGWDQLREETFARQKKLGVVGPDAELTKRHDLIDAWADMSEEIKPFLIRQMEVYAGFLEYADHHVGRLFDALDELGIKDDTIIYYMIGDNGPSSEGAMQGAFNWLRGTNDRYDIETPEYAASKTAVLGTPEAYNHYSLGWAHAMSTPYQWTKVVASHWGGTRNGLVVHWPAGIKAKGEVRHQFSHVIDVAPTVLAATGLPEPSTVHGVTQTPMEGTPMNYAFDGADEAERHTTQYFELMCNRGIYHDGWSAVTMHRYPDSEKGNLTQGLDDDTWELYDGNTDWTQAHDLAAEQPEKLAELKQLFLIEAAKHNVLPLDDRSFERLVPEIAGRPTLIQGTRQVILASMQPLPENAVLTLKNKSHSVTALIDVPEGGASGVIIAQGGRFGGWSLYAHEGRLTYCYNMLAVYRTKVAAKDPLTPGQHQVRMEFTYEGTGLGKGGTITLFVDGAQVGSGHIKESISYMYSADESTCAGRDTGSNVSDDYPAGDNAFTGTVHWARLDTADDAEHHLVADPDHVLRAAIAIH